MSVRIAISIGDINGIGPEIVIKAVSQLTLSGITPILLGHSGVLERYRPDTIPLAYHTISDAKNIRENSVNLLEAYKNPQKIEPGSITPESGSYAMQAVEMGIKLCKTNTAHALVTAPISKEAVNLAGYHIPGHTEFLAQKTNCEGYLMMLVHEHLRVGLVTIHEPLAKVPGLISKDSILHALRVMNESLKKDFNIQTPKIAVLGLNPHAGDGGYIGREEIDIIKPAIEKANSNTINAKGPFSADAFFGGRSYQTVDAVLAMYHDQGLIPFKTLAFGSGVNFTAGLPIIRTSPDHGTAFDIAGKNEADPSSINEAISLAITLAKNRKNVSV